MDIKLETLFNLNPYLISGLEIVFDLNMSVVQDWVGPAICKTSKMYVRTSLWWSELCVTSPNQDRQRSLVQKFSNVDLSLENLEI